MPGTKVGVVQCGSYIYDTPKTLEKLCSMAREAAENGAQLVLFPEAFLGGYPKLLDFGVVLGSRSSDGRDEFQKYYDSSIEENGPESERISGLAKELEVYIVVGVVEREGKTLYCSVFYYSPEGYMGKHRKLVPTALERVVWGCGDGSTMPVFDSAIGKMGGAICWENYMPMYRMHLYSQGIELYLAPTVDDRDVWLPTMQTIALEGRCFVLSSVQYLQVNNFPEDHPIRSKWPEDKVLIRGGSCVIDPLGTVLIEPEFNKECIRYTELDMAQIIRGKFDLDVAGHYSRPEVFKLVVNTQSMEPVTNSQP